LGSAADRLGLRRIACGRVAREHRRRWPRHRCSGGLGAGQRVLVALHRRAGRWRSAPLFADPVSALRAHSPAAVAARQPSGRAARVGTGPGPVCPSQVPGTGRSCGACRAARR
jgi:hypothetical protein